MEITNNQDMKMSVMFITYNRKKELLRALQSCVKNRMVGMEIIIVDNHSQDNTQEKVEAYLTNSDVPFNYFYSEVNMGVSEGRNTAFRMCRGEFVFCLDDDAMIDTKNFFQIIYDQMKKERDAVAAAVEIYEPFNERYLNGFIYEKDGRKYALSYIGAAHVLKREFFEGSYLYPPTIRFGSEEYYIAYKVRKSKKKMLYISETKVLHLPSKIARVSGVKRDMNIIVNNYVIRKLCYPVITLPFLTFAFCIRITLHGYLKHNTFQCIHRWIHERYNKEYIDRMSIKEWIRMLLDTNIKQVL